MSTTQIQPSLRLPFVTGGLERFEEIDCASRDTPRARLAHLQFDAMSKAFRPHGGFASADDVTHRLRRLPDQALQTPERWLASRKVLNLWWHDQTLMPVFQFDKDAGVRVGNDLVVRPVHDQRGHVDLLQVLGEVGLGERLDTQAVRLDRAHHALQPPVLANAFRDLRVRPVEAVERHRQVQVELRAVGGDAGADRRAPLARAVSMDGSFRSGRPRRG